MPAPGPRGGGGRRDRAVRAQRGQRGRGPRLPQRPAVVPRHPRGDRGRAGRARLPARAQLRDPVCDRFGGAPTRRRADWSARVTWILTFLGFAALIILHELGHFTAAKAVGMRVERFALFFPPLIAKVRRGETEYGIGALPLGGYVRITGMNPMEDIPPEVAHRAYFRQPVWKRIVVIGAGPLVNIVLAFVILAGLYWSLGTVGPPNTVAALERGTPAARVLKTGDAILA